MSIYTCKICNTSAKSFRALCKHIQCNHHITNLKINYFSLYDDSVFPNCIICDKKVIKLYKTDKRHIKTCSKECYVKSISGKSQSKEIITKRLLNTDQTKKEQTRQNTMMKKYGSLFFVFDKEARSRKLSEKISGKKHTKEHHEKVIESKRKNNTLKHSEQTKTKIKNKLNELYQSDDPPMTMGNGYNKKYKHGYIENMFYRSSYEKIFIEHCLKNNIKIESAETKEFRVLYIFENKKKYYYPDFFLPDYGIIVEIKPLSLLDDEKTQCKIHAAMKYHNIVLICEEELENLDEYFLHFKMSD